MTIKRAIQMAEMDMPQMYRVNGHNRPWYRRIFAKPGPKPKTRQITYRGRTPPQLAATLARIGEFREDPVSFDTLNKMRRHPMIKLATIVRAAPVITALRETRIECEDRRISAFIEEVFVDRWLLPLADTSIIPSYQFGTAPHEKVWQTEEVRATYQDDEGQEVVAYDGPALTYKKIKFVHPESLEGWRLQEDTGDFAGFVQKKRPGDKQDREVEAWKAFVYINRFLYGGFWGETEYSDVYPYWYYDEFFRALQADYLRFKAIPPIVGHAPLGQREDQEGNTKDNLEWAGEQLQKAYDNLVIMLPFETDEQGNQQWGYEELKFGEHSEIYTRAIEELDVMILRGLIVPERTVTQNMAAVGSYNQAAIHAERMLDAGKLEVDRFLTACNMWCVPQLVEDHFGPSAPPCKLFANAVSEDLKAKLHNIVITVLQNDREGIHQRQLAFTDLLDFLNIPFNRNPQTNIPEPNIEPGG